MPSSRILTQAVERLSNATDLPAITQAVAEAARQLVGSDGATFVLRDEDRCYYADEDAISPLWKGKRFPARSCISGWCMEHREVVLIRDIYQDPRIPHDAYRPTFVKSLCMVPIRSASPIGCIGSYWATEHEPSAEDIKTLQILANSSATALENLELRQALLRRSAERDDLTHRHRELEFQLHSLAHDLKNPLATMMGFAELLGMHSEKALDAKAFQYLLSIIRTGERLNRQIEKMLALYRLSSRSLSRQRVDLTSIAEELVGELKAQNPERQVETEIEPGLKVNADPDLLRLALENLFSNAFKYSRPKPSTWIRFGRADASTPEAESDAFVVEDHGVGFDPADADRLFQPLVRLHQETEFSGTGLGLASVARIVELHGGRVRAEGRPFEGAKFTFFLPR